MASSARPRRLALGPRGQRLSFEKRLRQKLWAMGLPAAGLVAVLLRGEGWTVMTAALASVALGWAIAVSLVMETVVRPLQTLANVIAALREDDFSFRARGGRRDDALGDLAIEVNALASTMQGQRVGAMEAVALAERMMNAMQTPVVAFDPGGRIRMLNPAAVRTFGVHVGDVVSNAGPGLEALLSSSEVGSMAVEDGRPGARWVVQRTSFRMRGLPHTLAVMSEVSSALREEERNAWRRLVRVMGHEINNSLTPIKSIAGSLRERLRREDSVAAGPGEMMVDLARGLGVIENRAESLNRFLQAYRQLSGLPKPRLRQVEIGTLVQRVAHLMREVAVRVEAGPEHMMLAMDEDQMQQALINLMKNAVEAALAADGEPEVTAGWKVDSEGTVIWILDNGLGVTNPDNLFVPFYTTKPEGAGIGLALALQIAESHGGTVRLANRADGQGCRAAIHLPPQADPQNVISAIT